MSATVNPYARAAHGYGAIFIRFTTPSATTIRASGRRGA
jgi:hypothetical protein